MNPTIEDDRLQDYRTDPAQTHQGARLATFDNMQPVEDTDRLRRLLFEVEHPQPDPTAAVDITHMLENPELTTILARLPGYIRLMQDLQQAERRDTCQPSALGTRCIVSGGEVIEIDAPTTGSDEQIPF